MRLWDVASGSQVAELKGHTDRVYSVAFSPDGKQLASGSGEWCVPVSWMISLPSRNKLNLCLSKRIECMFAHLSSSKTDWTQTLRPKDLRPLLSRLGKKGPRCVMLGDQG